MKKILIKLNEYEIPILVMIGFLWVLDRPGLFVFFLILPLIWVGGFYRTKHFFPATSLDLPLLLFSVLSMFSLIITPDVVVSSPKVLGIVLGISFYYALVRFWGSGQREFHIKQIKYPAQVAFIFFFIAWGSLIALLGLLGAERFMKYPFLSKIAELLPASIINLPGGVTGFQPNAISGTLVLFTPLCLYLWYKLLIKNDPDILHLFQPLNLSLTKFLLTGAILIQGLWWILAQTRGAWLGLASGVLFLIILELAPKRKFIAWILPILPVVLVYALWFRSLNGLEVDLSSFSGSQLTESLQFRLQVWDWAISTISVFPFTGVGYNVFRYLAPILFFGSWLGDVAHAHNIWLDIGVTIGVGGILIWIMLWFCHLRALWVDYAKSPYAYLQYISVGLIAGWYSYFVFGLADTIPLGSKLGLSIFFVLGIGQVFVERGVGRAEDGIDC